MAVRANLMPIKPGEAERLKLLIPYNAAWVAKIKAIFGRRWHPEEKCRSVPCFEEISERLLSLFGEEPAEVDRSPRPLKTLPICQDEEPKVVQLLEAMDQELIRRGYAVKTRKVYLGHVDRFTRFYRKNPQGLSKIAARAYLPDLLEKQKSSHTYVNQCKCALKFLYEKVLKQPSPIVNLSRPKRERKLPDILSRQAVIRLLETIDNSKPRVIMLLTYPAGLRLGESVYYS